MASSTPTRLAALALFVCAVAAGIVGAFTLPQLMVWILVVAFTWAAVTLWLRTVDRGGWRSQRDASGVAARHLAPGEKFDRAVKLTFAPNVPMAEALCSRLRANGIEAFVKRTQPFPGISGVTTDFGPAEVWVGEHDLERATELIE